MLKSNISSWSWMPKRCCCEVKMKKISKKFLKICQTKHIYRMLVNKPQILRANLYVSHSHNQSSSKQHSTGNNNYNNNKKKMQKKWRIFLCNKTNASVQILVVDITVSNQCNALESKCWDLCYSVLVCLLSYSSFIAIRIHLFKVYTKVVDLYLQFGTFTTSMQRYFWKFHSTHHCYYSYSA